jgi:hypothetical protein
MKQKAWATKTLVLIEFSLTTSADWKGSKQKIQGFTDSPGMWIRTEVARSFSLGSSHNDSSRVRLVDCHCQKRITLVVTKTNIKAGMVLLDERVLKNKSFNLIAHLNPLD